MIDISTLFKDAEPATSAAEVTERRLIIISAKLDNQSEELTLLTEGLATLIKAVRERLIEA